MSKIQTLIKLWNEDRRQVFIALYNHIVHTGITNFIPDKTYLNLPTVFALVQSLILIILLHLIRNYSG